MSLLLALPALLAAPGPASEVPAAPEWALLVVEFSANAKFAGFPAHCPGAGASEEADPEAICTAAFFEGPVRIVRRLAGPVSVRGVRLRYMAHAYPMLRGMRLLVIAYVRPGEGGLFASWWQWPDDRGEVCLGERVAANLEIAEVWQRWPGRIITGEGDGRGYRMRCLDLRQPGDRRRGLRGASVRSN